MDAVVWDRLLFGFTITFHYLFPQLTMGLALLIVVFKILALRTGVSSYNDMARFWARIFGLNFALGVVTGIPMEFQFGTNWARFSDFAGGVIGITLAMEGMFAFFAESAFLGLFLFGEKKLGPKGHFAVGLMLLLGSWLSGYFIVVTNAFMQHPVGHAMGARGALQLNDVWAYLFNPWAIWQYAHTMTAAVITGSFGGLMRDLFRHDRVVANLRGELYPEIAVLWGFLFALFLEWEGERLQPDEVRLGVIVTILGAFLTRLLAILRGMKGWSYV